MKALGWRLSPDERDRISTSVVSDTAEGYRSALLRAQLEKVISWLEDHSRWQGSTLAQLLRAELDQGN